MRNLNIGSFAGIAPGWENTDVTPHIFVAKLPGAARVLRGLGLMSRERYEEHRRGTFSKVRYMNAARPFPYPTGTFDNVFTCHMLEHLYRSQAERCLQEIFRVLKPGGLLRVVVPDLDMLVRAYDQRDPSPLLEAIYVSYQPRDKNRHHWMYTAESLSALLTSVGFHDVERVAYQQGRCPDIDVLDSRPHESLFMEAIK